jgi:hypothetical protein
MLRVNNKQILYRPQFFKKVLHIQNVYNKGPWLYVSWIYIYLCSVYFIFSLWWGVLDTNLFDTDKVCQKLIAGR